MKKESFKEVFSDNLETLAGNLEEIEEETDKVICENYLIELCENKFRKIMNKKGNDASRFPNLACEFYGDLEDLDT